MLFSQDPSSGLKGGPLVVGYGYRVDEVDLPELGPVKSTLEIIKHSNFDSASFVPNRRPVSVSLGCHLVGVSQPKPDLADPISAAAGVCKRFGVEMPKPNRVLRAEFRQFVRGWIRKHLTPLAPDSDLSVDTWLDSCSYPAWRKAELKKKWEALNKLGAYDWHRYCKSFVKDENYPAYKYPRCINSRSDEYKCFVGPVFRLIEKKVFALKYFIKKIPVPDRPRYILENLFYVGAEPHATDYTAYEASFDRELMEVCEFELYEYMTQYLPTHQEFMDEIRRTQGGTNTCVFKFFTVMLEATRMSGEMNTSLGNGFSNLMANKFLCKRRGIKSRIVVEGDDGLFTTRGGCPPESDYADLGMNIKLERHTYLEHASFCGIIFSMVDLCNITDPYDVLANFGWTTREYVMAAKRKRMALLRCKAISLAYQYRGAPVLGALAQYGLRVTRGVDVRHFIEENRTMSLWERDQAREALHAGKYAWLYRTPGMDSRLLMEKVYGLTVEQQILIEKYLDGLDELQPLSIPWINQQVPASWTHYCHNYVVATTKADLLQRQSNFSKGGERVVKWPDGISL